MRVSKTTALILSVLITGKLVAQESNQMMIEKSVVLKDLEFQPFYEIGSRTFKVLDVDKFQFRYSFGVGYRLPLKKKSAKNIKKDKVNLLKINYHEKKLNHFVFGRFRI